jgi:hypothetical protein
VASPGADHLGVQGRQEPLLVVVAEPVGVAGERGFLRQHGQPGEQGAGRVGDQVIDVGDRRVPVSFSASRDSSHEVAGMTEVPG